MAANLRAARAPRRFAGAGHWWVPYLFVAPFVALFLAFLIVPIVLAFRNSMFSTRSSGLGFGGPPKAVFSGVDNYVQALQDTDFLASFGRVLLFGVVQVPVMILVAGAFALLFDAGMVRAGRFFQTAMFLPYAVPSVIAALLWGFLYQPAVSPLLQGLAAVGLDLDVLAPGAVLWAVANISTWVYTGINMIILFAALQSIPREMFEAARLDGAGELRLAVSVKIPMIWPAVLLTVLSSIIGTLQLFNEPLVLRTLTHNISSTYTPNMSIYTVATQGSSENLSAAMAVILGVATLVVSVFVMRLTTRKGVVRG
ncbi:carbohydrate ABC transporter permease [Micromonospora sp. 067-2]|uniref:carbohydrate ABC transporter permease n=1 Tax=Micromonospora sp. 067-2 TaxID=2789270 RepID=UPI00397D5345